MRNQNPAPAFVDKLEKNQIFIYGSNLRSINGAGAALYAKKNFGAVFKIGEGRNGQCYALPTKDENIEIRTLEEIKKSIYKFIDYAIKHPDLEFLCSAIGCGLAGYSPSDIKLLWPQDLPDNIRLPIEFL